MAKASVLYTLQKIYSITTLSIHEVEQRQSMSLKGIAQKLLRSVMVTTIIVSLLTRGMLLKMRLSVLN